MSHRQAHRPAGVNRLLDVIIDETAFELRMKGPGVMADQIRHLLALAGTEHATVRIIPGDAPLEAAGAQLRRAVVRGHHRPHRRLRITLCSVPNSPQAISMVAGLASRTPWLPT